MSSLLAHLQQSVDRWLEVVLHVGDPTSSRWRPFHILILIIPIFGSLQVLPPALVVGLSVHCYHLELCAWRRLFQVDVWCSQTQQRIVGYYQANACVSDSRWATEAVMAAPGGWTQTHTLICVFLFSHSPTPCALKIADKISEQCENAVLLMVRKVCMCEKM